ncbi:methyl-accepting chemotaxis protein [Gymnodinialimonas ceratoperidinii]|uniref:Cache domain-containing protein n=1 Tax=Gymnodinialimonas ceratoperidinii TaxID=2856823 RepID=A0A8F6YE16_9RHOB|nr:methyl-accepting chemotaxis protein [Gymnodinialimonas ceratoperidinii]QXT40762.1 cache domain-containing protein [Gymnodinialimonas ceratoperidinii]
MKYLSQMSLSIKLIAALGAVIATFCVAVAVIGHGEIRRTFDKGASLDTWLGARMVAREAAEAYDGVSYTMDENGQIEQFVWSDMPSGLPNSLAQRAVDLLGVSATILTVDPSAQNFGTLAGATATAEVAEMTNDSPAAFEAVLAGQTYTGNMLAAGLGYRVLYLPIFSETGSVIGAIATAVPTDAFSDHMQSVFINGLLLIFGTLGGFMTIAYLIVRRMLDPFSTMTRSIVALSEGELDQKFAFADRDDEVGRMARGLSVLQSSMVEIENLRKSEADRLEREHEKQRDQAFVVDALTEGLARLGNLDLTKQIESQPDAPFPAEYEGLRTTFNMLVDNLSDNVEAIRDVADEVNQDAREMSSSSQDLSARTESQAATLEESASALEQLSESVQSTAANATDAEATTDENRTVAKRTGEIVENAISAMAEIEASSQQITQIISVIDDIAFQTNLLALNAGVEAARAGEAGRGFAVVASEVRALAQHSSASAQEIKDLIASSSEQVQSGSKLVRKAGDSIGDIIIRVDKVAGLVSDIAVSAKEQSIGVTEINSGVRELDAATQRNAAMAEEASAASESLTNAADRLASHLARFRMNGAVPTALPPSDTSHAPDAYDDVAAYVPSASVSAAALPLDAPPADVFKDF